MKLLENTLISLNLLIWMIFELLLKNSKKIKYWTNMKNHKLKIMEFVNSFSFFYCFEKYYIHKAKCLANAKEPRILKLKILK